MPDPATTVAVTLPTGRYDIRVQTGLLRSLGLALAALFTPRRVGVVTDSRVAPLYLADLTKSLQSAGFEPIAVILPAGEENKTLATIAAAYDKLLSAPIERSTPILALGGGVIGDMAGFVAATVLRGVPLIQVPTTLLAMVDASVGGKTGVNHAVGKNLIGAFHQPSAVFIDPIALTTLPPADLRGGLTECIKHDLIRDAAGFDELEKSLPRILQLDMPMLSRLIAHNVAIKARVVEADPFEKAERAHLNFGHTFGHAIERISNFAVSHGDAVALGMTAALHLSRRLDLLDEAARLRAQAVIKSAGLPTGGLTLDPAAVIAAMASDKKVQSGRLRFILLDRIGHAVIRDDVPADAVRQAVELLG